MLATLLQVLATVIGIGNMLSASNEQQLAHEFSCMQMQRLYGADLCL